MEFIVTKLETDSRAVVRFYNKRGTAEQWIKEGKQAVKMTRLGTVKLSRICPFCGRIPLDQRLRINDLAVAAGGENAAKLLNLTVP